MKILAIESSCDETSVAVVEDGNRVLSNVIASSQLAFEASGGVIPEEAARRQVECVLPVLHQALTNANMDWNGIDAIAVTKGPGLLGSLLVGTTTARALGALHKKPLIGVHHTLGHVSSTWLETPDDDQPDFPILTLSASGGHTELWLRESHTKGILLGRTRDDAAGEAFDKGASLLGLPYPGGPSISKAAEGGDSNAFPFPLPLKKEATFDFSFSGLKTALRYTIRDVSPHPRKDAALQTTNYKLQTFVSDLAASYQRAICLHLLDRIEMALETHADIKEVHLVGGVSANTALRSMVNALCEGTWIVRLPQKLSYCTDNAAMIAAAAYFLTQEMPESATEDFTTEASLPLASAIKNS